MSRPERVGKILEDMGFFELLLDGELTEEKKAKLLAIFARTGDPRYDEKGRKNENP